jgi:hypothetical protein
MLRCFRQLLAVNAVYYTVGLGTFVDKTCMYDRLAWPGAYV